MKNFKNYALQRSETSLDEYGQLKKESFQTVKNLSIAVFEKQFTELANNPLFADISHVGVYKGTFKDFQKLDRLDNTYIVKRFIQGNRKVLLYLDEVINEH